MCLDDALMCQSRTLWENLQEKAEEMSGADARRRTKSKKGKESSCAKELKLKKGGGRDQGQENQEDGARLVSVSNHQ